MIIHQREIKLIEKGQKIQHNNGCQQMDRINKEKKSWDFFSFLPPPHPYYLCKEKKDKPNSYFFNSIMRIIGKLLTFPFFLLSQAFPSSKCKEPTSTSSKWSLFQFFSPWLESVLRLKLEEGIPFLHPSLLFHFFSKYLQPIFLFQYVSYILKLN